MSFQRWDVRILAFLGFGLLLSPQASQAIDSSALNNPQVSQVTVDSAGHLLAVWSTQTGAGSELFYQPINPFSLRMDRPAIRLAESSSRLRRPQIIVDRQGDVHVLWQERFTKAVGARDAQGTWVHYMRFNAEQIQQDGQARHVVLNDRPKAQHPDLAVDPRGNALVVWEEGAESLVLLKIRANGRVSERHLIPSGPGADRRAFPTVATDRKGNIHLAWTDTSNSKLDRMVYTVLDAKGLRATVGQRVLHSVPSALGLRKSLSVEPSGEIRLAWTTRQTHGWIGEIGSDQNRLVLNPGGAVTDLADRHLHETATLTLNDPGEVALGKHPSILPAGRTDDLNVRPENEQAPRSALSAGIEKQLKKQVLEFSSWTGAPPSRGGILSFDPALRHHRSSPRLFASSRSNHQITFRRNPFGDFERAVLIHRSNSEVNHV